MRLQDNKLIYIASYNEIQSSGVHYKVLGILSAAEKLGYNVELLNNSSSKVKDGFLLMKALINTNARYYIIRSYNEFNLVFLLYYFYAKLQGKILIIDVPTPMKAYLHEKKSSKIHSLKMWCYMLLYYLSGPWSLWPFNRIIQYGEESKYFSFGNKNRTLKMGNGIDCSRIKIREKNYTIPFEKLILVGVANVNFYHGFDRIINAIYLWNKSFEKSYNIIFHIIGAGPAIIDLKKLTYKLHLEESILFHGYKNSDEIYQYYSKAHLAISSIGLFRINLKESSVLKSREYCLSGIPFIATGKDPDFEIDVPFRMLISNDENLEDIIKVFNEFKCNRVLYSDEEIREYALKNFSFESKIQKILRKLN